MTWESNLRLLQLLHCRQILYYWEAYKLSINLNYCVITISI